MLSFSEFFDLIDAFGNQVAASKKEDIFKAADKNGDGVICVDELAALLAIQQEKQSLITCCPVCGEALEGSDQLNNMIHLTLCFDEGTGNQVMTGGFLTDKQASNGVVDDSEPEGTAATSSDTLPEGLTHELPSPDEFLKSPAVETKATSFDDLEELRRQLDALNAD